MVLGVQEGQRQQPDEQERRPERGVQVELERRVHAAVVAPPGDDEVHRHEHDLEEHEEEDEVEAEEDAEQGGLQHQHPHRVRLQTVADRLRRDQPDREEQRRESDHEQADAVDADEVTDAERVDPRVVLDELVAGGARVEGVQQVSDEPHRRGGRHVADRAHDLGAPPRQHRDQHRAGDGREDDEREQREPGVAHQPALTARNTSSATAPSTTPRA